MSGRVVLEMNGCRYHRHGGTWYDSNNLHAPMVIITRLDAKVRQSVDLREQLLAEERADCLQLHQQYLRDRGLPFRGAGPFEGVYQRYAHCWACHHPISSGHDLQCYGCRWILCRCGGCGCGYHHRITAA